jgi:hypothetical protein
LPFRTTAPPFHRKNYHCPGQPLYIRPMAQHVDRYVPADTNGGWGFATAVIVFALVLIAGVTYIHKTTYKHPTDVTWRGIGEGSSSAAATTH